MRKIKVVLYGDTQVGKTQVLNRLLGKEFVDKHTATIAAVPRVKKYVDADLQVQYFDLGHNVDDGIQKKCFSTADQICLVFNMQNAKDLASCWNMDYLARTAPNARIILIGTHHDHDESTKPFISEDKVLNFIASFKSRVSYIKVSSKNNTGFEALSALICSEVQEVEDEFGQDTGSLWEDVSVVASSQANNMNNSQAFIQKLKTLAAGNPLVFTWLDKYASEELNENSVVQEQFQRLTLSPVKRDPLGTPVRHGGINVLSPVKPFIPAYERSPQKSAGAQPFWTVTNPKNMQPSVTSFNANFWLRAMQFFLVLGGAMAIVALLTCAPAVAVLGIKTVLGVAAQDISVTTTFGALTSLLTSVGLYAVRQMSDHPMEMLSNTAVVPGR